MVYLQKEERVVISSLSDVQNLPPNLSEVHFRKFLNKKVLLEVLGKCELKRVSVSKSAFSRCSPDCLEMIRDKKIEILVSNAKGRPSFLEFNKELILW